MGGVVWSHDRG